MKIAAEDRLELLELPSRYGDIIDSAHWGRLGEIFTTDAIFVADHLELTLEGLSAITEFMASFKDHPLAHLMLNIYVDEEGPTGVQLFSRVIAPVKGDDPKQRAFGVIHGDYTDEVVKTRAGWRIQRRVFSKSRYG